MMTEEVCWTTKTGKRIPLSKMSDAHLLNAIPFARAACERTLKKFANAALDYASTAPEHAADLAENGAMRVMLALIGQEGEFDPSLEELIEENKDEDPFLTYLAMKKEAKGRFKK